MFSFEADLFGTLRVAYQASLVIPRPNEPDMPM